MPRKKIQIEMRGLRTPRERMWDAMLQLNANRGRCFTISQVEDLAFPLHQTTIEDYLEGLVAAGFVNKIKPQKRGDTPHFTPAEFALVKPVLQAPRVDKHGKPARQGEGVDAMWSMAKVLPRFTSDQLAAAATQGGVVVTPQTAKTYARALAKSGHFRVVKAAKHLGGRAGVSPEVYQLANNTGPHPPAITSEKCVFDRNTGTITPTRKPQEVCDAIG